MKERGLINVSDVNLAFLTKVIRIDTFLLFIKERSCNHSNAKFVAPDFHQKLG